MTRKMNALFFPDFVSFFRADAIEKVFRILLVKINRDT